MQGERPVKALLSGQVIRPGAFFTLKPRQAPYVRTRTDVSGVSLSPFHERANPLEKIRHVKTTGFEIRVQVAAGQGEALDTLVG